LAAAAPGTVKAVGDLEVTQSRAKQPGHLGRGEAEQVRNFGIGVVPELDQRDGRSLPPGGDPELGHHRNRRSMPGFGEVAQVGWPDLVTGAKPYTP
jgi:hypothetical protein